MAIIILAFVPVFALTGMEGKLFHPLAFTKTFAMLGSTIIAVTLVPVLCTFLIRGRLHPEEHNPIMRFLRAGYRPILSFALRNRAITLLIAASFFGFAVYLATTIGSEFMPPLDEETAMWMPITDPSISLTKATELMKEQDRIIASDPAVKAVVGKIGRAETSTDPAPINMSETIVTLTDKDTWPKGTTKDSILQRLDEKLRTPGVTNIWTQPIRNRIDMLSTGIRTQSASKCSVKTCKSLNKNPRKLNGHCMTFPEQSISTLRELPARPISKFELIATQRLTAESSVGDIQDVIETAIGERTSPIPSRGASAIPFAFVTRGISEKISKAFERYSYPT
jgi:Cu(I)/Ag(I) efflux system membrane protein CusA/SilA